MHQKQACELLLGILITLGILGSLSAVAIPHAIDMAHQSEFQRRETEFFRVSAAVDEMLQESPCGKLISVGPVADLSLVRTADPEPLFLVDYLPVDTRRHLPGDCVYSFTSDGYVLQNAY